MLSLLLRWIVNAGALLLVAYLYPGVHVQDLSRPSSPRWCWGS